MGQVLRVEHRLLPILEYDNIAAIEAWSGSDNRGQLPIMLRTYDHHGIADLKLSGLAAHPFRLFPEKWGEASTVFLAEVVTFG